MEISADKLAVLEQLKEWFFASKQPYITVGGYAGTGKTTLISLIKTEFSRKDPKISIAFCSYTGKASQVLQEKLTAAKALGENDSVSTIHSLIYSPIVNGDKEIIGWEKKPNLECNLIIVDEASMVSKDIWEDLLSYRIGIIAVGDHGQLPPIGDDFNLMRKPHLLLKEIHRQQEGNPILDLSIMARESGEIPFGKHGEGIYKLSRQDSDAVELINDLFQSYGTNTLILCGYNFTRQKLNQYVRQALEIYVTEPVPGDRVICLHNNHKQQIFNGMLGTILNLEPVENDFYLVDIDFDSRKIPYHGLILAEQFGSKSTLKPLKYNKEQVALFDYGYALTVHKAQGSQAQRVILFEERMKKMSEVNWRKWLYTAVTRAESELYIFS